MNKKSLNETEICQNFITPAIARAGWDKHTQIRREYTFTAGRVMVRGKLATRGKKKRADYLLFYQSNLALAVVEAKEALVQQLLHAQRVEAARLGVLHQQASGDELQVILDRMHPALDLLLLGSR